MSTFIHNSLLRKTRDTDSFRFCLRPWSLIGRIITTVIFSTTLSTAAWGQVPSIDPEQIGRGMSEMLGQILTVVERIKRASVQLNPSVVAVETGSNTVRVTFTNNSNEDSICVVTLLRYAAPKKPDPDTLANGIVAPDAAHRDSIIADSLKTLAQEKQWSLVSWITGVPDTLTLAPGESRVVTLQLTPPGTLSPGEYSAHLIALGRAVLPNANTVDSPVKPLPVTSFNPDQPNGSVSASRIVYRHRQTKR